MEKASWPFASSLVVSFGSVKNAIRNLCVFGAIYSLSITFLGGTGPFGQLFAGNYLDVSKYVETQTCGRRHAAIHSAVSPRCEGNPRVEAQGDSALGIV